MELHAQIKLLSARTTFKARTGPVVAAGLAALVFAAGALGSPGLDVRSAGSGPITAGNAPAGPSNDPTTQQGQWFLDNNGLAVANSHEFHDNIDGNGGGPPNHLAIQGSFVNYVMAGPNIVGYVMNVSITNNTNLVNGPYAAQPNLHGENRGSSTPYVGTMFDVRFSSHWADDGVIGNFNAGGPNLVSNNPGTTFGESNSFAVGYDALAWYSHTTAGGIPGTIFQWPQGQFQVPTWDFGNIVVGQTVTRLLTFGLYNAVSNAAVPPASVFQGQDFLIARSNDIRIASYFQDDPVLNGIFDRLQPYPPGSFNFNNSQYGNSSVFFNVPAPGAGVLLALSGVLASRRRRTR